MFFLLLTYRIFLEVFEEEFSERRETGEGEGRNHTMDDRAKKRQKTTTALHDPLFFVRARGGKGRKGYSEE
ncbi:hypothetical protein AKJ39_03940 [candidate division MSBL1 archaeon SCGC-AAA259J03]|uniref:Uncharacterized protein n=1 Tax=candidate division MSBL1 archaeon SCGC-AAA259J03 TaxID=1698269 RepID=A0A656YW23_9EURY|nr:hypothetical protein AKJ39_03940 [candidate division MSBL1 archaeon SCGC-AAA259J03]